MASVLLNYGFPLISLRFIEFGYDPKKSGFMISALGLPYAIASILPFKL